MSLPPGTRIPCVTGVHGSCFQCAVGDGLPPYEEPCRTCLSDYPDTSCWQPAGGVHIIRADGYWRGLVEGLTLGAIAGGLLSACALALAWAHMGG